MTSPSTLHPGDAVRLRGERWRVRHVTTYERCAIVELTGLQASNAGTLGRFLTPFDAPEPLPRASERPIVVRPRQWRAAARRQLAVTAPAWESLRAAAQARIDVLPYQLEPALAVTSGAACRLLLADAVGLGKTIQAGLIVAELLARERGARVLVVTPASLREQWREELATRFDIEAETIDSDALARAAAQLPGGVNPWSLPRVAIASIDFLKRPDVIRALEPLVWDLVAFDEAHALAGRSDRAAAADLVARRGRRVLLITATPHSGDAQAYERLCALGRLQDDRLLVFRRSRAEAGVPGARASRRLTVRPSREERAMHQALAAYRARVAREAPPDAAAAARLAMIVLARRACSSAASLARSLQRRRALLDPGSEAAEQMRLPLDDRFIGEDEEPIDELSAPGLLDPAAEGRCLDRVLALATAVQRESKIAALSRLLRRAGEPALVFTEYRDTLQQLASQLAVDAALLHGGLTAAERARAIRRFTHGDVPLLLATDAASEGLNLHHRCRLVVNLDVPWTPLRLEQRVGRVDRLGQRRRVHAITLVARGTPEERIAAGLQTRADRAARDAPFDAAAPAPLTRRPPADSPRAARDEAARLAGCRRMTAAGHERGTARPQLTASGSASGRMLLALHLFFVDGGGSPLWHTMAGLGLSCPPLTDRRAASVREWFSSVTAAHAPALAAAAAFAHERALASLRGAVAVEARLLAERERAMLDALHRDGARLAAPLLQPGLFDRRVLRDRAEVRRVFDELAERARERLTRLALFSTPAAGDRLLLFALAGRGR